MYNFIRRAWARLTSPDQKRAGSLWFMPKTAAGVRVTYESALTQAVVWACVRVIAEGISQLPWRCMHRTDRGNEILDTHPADRLLYSAPNALVTPAVWKELVMREVLTWGNSYHEIQWDGRYHPVALHHIATNRVDPMVVDGNLWYRVTNEDKEDDYIPASDMFHVRGLGDDLAGWSVIRHAAQAIGLGVAQDQSMASLIANGSRPAGFLAPTGNMSKEAAQRILEEWETTYGGSANKGKTALISHAVTYTPMGLPNTDAQMLESRRFSVIEICRFFRVPPHKVMDLERATFANIEHQAIEFVQDALVPWGVKLEQEANRKLISDTQRGRVFTKINFNALLRGDFASRTAGYQKLFDRGVYSINDILELEDRNTIGPDGDVRFVPLNMQTLDRALEPPQPPPVPLPVEPEEDDEGDVQPRDGEAQAVYRPILWDAVDRITARECRLLERDKSGRWCDSGHQGYIVNQLVPHAAALASVASRTMDLAQWAEQRCTQLRGEINGHMAAGGEASELLRLWVDRVDATTDELMGCNHVTI